MAQLTPDPTPVLLTIDVEIAYDRDRHEQTEVLWRLVTECKTLPATWFCTADAAELFSAPLRALIATGHSIGCHGYDHGDWEDYRHLSPECVLQTLSAATQRIEAALGVRPRVFRGPRMTTSAATHAALRVLGYVADFSVCAWRFDVMAARCFNLHWLTMQPTPYRPLVDAPFQLAGNPITGELMVVPLSGFAVPLVSGALYLLGAKVMQAIVKIMLYHANKPNTPVVYLFHSYEFVDLSGVVDHRPVHQRYYPCCAKTRYQMNLQFIELLRDTINFETMSVDTYLARLSHAT